ncbi:hypothetical protein [Myxococcus landrumensis]|uniref:Uncharacterized protein n=1 Tax=Myxococcus landrumensis TaxID=2813577 RepID=A0ABX7MYD6_9BACT|nr:hypothetical protein [Myxococcus landrumus]QSQ11301.1 hypothetical protein JY572_23110 [Myxococcus landrumus]
MSMGDDKSPALPEELRAAMLALRGEKPSPRMRARLQASLAQAERTHAAPPRREQASAWVNQPGARVLAGAVLTGALALLFLPRGNEGSGPELFPAREVTFQIPGGGAGWLELPWTHAVHSGEPATVWLETSPPLDSHPHLRELPSLELVGCDEARCVHEFTARTGASATPLRVLIDKPGRYEFRVSHASDNRHIQEHFVVVAL